ncbi:hypothetical protein [Tenacibaculum agarivorans]|uniref:hypothetical protein n=1 Tax=Tenacibaculum agarivorans TaxID=1908389 RepID=UPI000AFEA3AD|nr:hypothetical protein [Tenacibaculum agarivorans]
MNNLKFHTKNYLKIIFLLTIICKTQTVFSQLRSPESISCNTKTLVLVPSFEGNPKTNNLSISGLNHSLLFAQLLNKQLSNNCIDNMAIYALSPDYKEKLQTLKKIDMKPLETIEPFAVSHKKSVNVKSLNTFLKDFHTNKSDNLFVVGADSNTIGRIIDKIAPSNSDIKRWPRKKVDYLVLTKVSSGRYILNYFNDGINPKSEYPDIKIPRTKCCPNLPVTLRTSVPTSSDSFTPYKNQTVYFIRHAEAHPGGHFENGNYVCRGEWRALGANTILYNIMDGKPDYIFSSNPTQLIDGYSYVRPSLTIAPFAIQYGLPITLASFEWYESESLANALFNKKSKYFNHKDNQTIIVCWEHGNLRASVISVFEELYKVQIATNKHCYCETRRENPKPGGNTIITCWRGDNYDSVWILKTDNEGNLTFANTCEHIPTEKLPTSCPIFKSNEH